MRRKTKLFEIRAIKTYLVKKNGEYIFSSVSKDHPGDESEL